MTDAIEKRRKTMNEKKDEEETDKKKQTTTSNIERWNEQSKKRHAQKKMSASTAGDDDSDYEEQPRKKMKKKNNTSEQAVQTEHCPELAIHPMTHEDIMQMQLSCSLSGRQTIQVCRSVRQGINYRRAFEPNYPELIAERNKMFAPYFKIMTMKSVDVDGPVYGIFCHDVPGILRHLQWLHQRPIKTLHLGADAGQAFLKVDFTIEFGERFADAPPASSHDASIPDHGRRRVIILACIPCVKETHENLGIIFETIGFPDDVPFIFIADLKLNNLVLGLAAPGAMYGCCYCEQKLTVKVAMRDHLKSGKLRSFRSISDHHKDFVDSKDSSRTAQNHCSCSNQPLPLFAAGDNVPLIKGKVAPPGLHLLRGANWFFHRMEDIYPKVSKWWRKKNFVRPAYHGGDFEGNQVRELLRPESVAELKIIAEAAAAEVSHHAPDKHSKEPMIMLLAQAVAAFADVIDSCFGDELQEGWQDSIILFRNALLKLRVTRLTIKFHIVCVHVETWCLHMKGGLANWHEQSLEAAHLDFATLWRISYAVTDVTKKQFGDNLLHCVLAFNARHSPISRNTAPPDPF